MYIFCQRSSFHFTSLLLTSLIFTSLLFTPLFSFPSSFRRFIITLEIHSVQIISVHFTSLHFTSLIITLVILFLKVCDLQWKVASVNEYAILKCYSKQNLQKSLLFKRAMTCWQMQTRDLQSFDAETCDSFCTYFIYSRSKFV